MKLICGYWALDGAPTPAGTLDAMRTAHVRCDTPHLDAWRQDPLAFGSTWWSPQTGLTPPQCIVRHPETGCVVVADARLDNPAELRAALGLPAPDDAPDATTDHASRLILHAWLRWSDACVDHIDGDFAFAVHDPRQQRLFLARDRMGQRPLYVHHVPGKLLVFGSTSHAVLAHSRVPKDINEARIADYLLESRSAGLEGVDFTSTFHLAVERHPPRHVRSVDAQGERLRQYWQLEPGRAGPLPKTDDEWAEALTAAMERAVAQRLAGPQRVGCMLSGGMDSTSLAIIAADQLRAAGLGPLPSFSAIDSSRDDCLETRAVRAASQHPGLEPHLFDIAEPGDLLPELERFLEEFDEPFDALMTMIDAQYANAARANVDSVIDGANGDSLFLPGGSLSRQVRSGHWLAVWRNAQGMTRYGGRPLQYLRTPLRAALIPDWLHRLLTRHRDRRRQALITTQAHLATAFADRTRVLERLQTLKQRSPASFGNATMESAAILMHTFPVAAAERYFRVATRHGITPLTPFSERCMLELCVNLPDRQRMRDGWAKPLLRHAMRGRMPEAVRQRYDKQHLGWRLTSRLWDRHDDLPAWPEIARGPLAGYLAPQQPAQDPPTPGHRWPRQLLFMIQLEHWVRRTRPLTPNPSPPL